MNNSADFTSVASKCHDKFSFPHNDNHWKLCKLGKTSSLVNHQTNLLKLYLVCIKMRNSEMTLKIDIFNDEDEKS